MKQQFFIRCDSSNTQTVIIDTLKEKLNNLKEIKIGKAYSLAPSIRHVSFIMLETQTPIEQANKVKNTLSSMNLQIHSMLEKFQGAGGYCATIPLPNDEELEVLRNNCITKIRDIFSYDPFIIEKGAEEEQQRYLQLFFLNYDREKLQRWLSDLMDLCSYYSYVQFSMVE